MQILFSRNNRVYSQNARYNLSQTISNNKKNKAYYFSKINFPAKIFTNKRFYNKILTTK